MDIIGILAMMIAGWVLGTIGWGIGGWIYKKYVQKHFLHMLGMVEVPDEILKNISATVVLNNGKLICVGDLLIAQKSYPEKDGYHNHAAYREFAIKIIDILPTLIVYTSKHTLELDCSPHAMLKSEFIARDFRHLTEAEKKYLAF